MLNPKKMRPRLLQSYLEFLQKMFGTLIALELPKLPEDWEKAFEAEALSKWVILGLRIEVPSQLLESEGVSLIDLVRRLNIEPIQSSETHAICMTNELILALEATEEEACLVSIFLGVGKHTSQAAEAFANGISASTLKEVSAEKFLPNLSVASSFEVGQFLVHLSENVEYMIAR